MNISRHDIELQLYRMFNKELMKNTEINWFEVEDIYKKIGNAPGIYPDSLLMLYSIINNYHIKKIVELGSGVSTLYFSKISKDKSIEFISYEEKDKWGIITNELLNYYKLKTQIKKFVELDNIQHDIYNADIIFIDCSNEIRIKLLESNKINHIPIVIVDDCERKNLSTSCSKFMSNSKRHCFYIYNGVGRIDRHLFINSTNLDIDDMIKQNKL